MPLTGVHGSRLPIGRDYLLDMTRCDDDVNPDALITKEQRIHRPAKVASPSRGR